MGQIVKVRNAVTALLASAPVAAASISDDWLPELKLSGLTNGTIYLFVRVAVSQSPTGQELRRTRATRLPIVSVEVLVCGKAVNTSAVYADPFLNAAEAIEDHLQANKTLALSGGGEAGLLRTSIDPLADAEMFDTTKVFGIRVVGEYVYET